MVKRKCQKQQGQHNEGRCFCECLRKIDPKQHFRENTRDMAMAIMDVMVLCGIPERKVRPAKQIIINAFKHYDVIRYRIDEVPTKLLRKEYLMFDLACKCSMTRMETQLTYSIVKRAFKAFYYGTNEYSITDPKLEAQMVHTQECLWVHAAKRTAQIYAEYEGMFFPTQKKFEEQIRCVYKKLYERMQSRASPLVLQSCCCRSCVKTTDTVSADSIIAANDDASVDLPESKSVGDARKYRKQKRRGGKTKEEEVQITNATLPRCKKCKCPMLTCSCEMTKKVDILNHDCSQGPFKVRWIRVDDDYEPEPFITRPEKQEMPLDCDDLSEMTLGQGTTSSEICDYEGEICEEEISLEAETSTEASILPTVYSCHMPDVNYTPVMLDCRPICDRGGSMLVIKDAPCAPRSKKSKSTTSSRLISGESGLTGKSTDKSSEYAFLDSRTSGELVPYPPFGDGDSRKTGSDIEDHDIQPPRDQIPTEDDMRIVEPPKFENPFEAYMRLMDPPEPEKPIKADTPKVKIPKLEKPARGDMRRKFQPSKDESPSKEDLPKTIPPPPDKPPQAVTTTTTNIMKEVPPNLENVPSKFEKPAKEDLRKLPPSQAKNKNVPRRDTISKKDQPKTPKVERTDKGDLRERKPRPPNRLLKPLLEPIKEEDITGDGPEVFPNGEPPIDKDTGKRFTSTRKNDTDLKKINIKRTSGMRRKSLDFKNRRTSSGSSDGNRYRRNKTVKNTDNSNIQRKTKRVSFSDKNSYKSAKCPCKICHSKERRQKKHVSKICREGNDTGRVSYRASACAGPCRNSYI